MRRIVLKWIVPGLATILLGTTATVLSTGANMASDLTERSSTALKAAGLDWANVDFDARDAKLSGTATNSAELTRAVLALKSVSGMQSLTSAVEFAPLARPYRFAAVVKDGRIMLSGAVPDRTIAPVLVAEAGNGADELQLASGAPARAAWREAADFVVQRAGELDQGTVSLTDLTLSIAGRAKSSKAFDSLQIALASAVPSGLSVGEVTVEPAVVSPYRFTAVFDGKSLSLTGDVPSGLVIDRLRSTAPSAIKVSTGLALASGEPSHFADLAALLVASLTSLEQGRASIDGDKMTLSGAPASGLIAQTVVDALHPTGAIITLDPPQIADYVFTAARANGNTVLDGYVPDEATRHRLAGESSVDVAALELGRGAPARFDSAVDFGLAALDHMSNGRFALHATDLTLEGTAATAADYRGLSKIIADGAPQGLVLKVAQVTPPTVSPYVWSAEKAKDGSIAFAGYVPSKDVRDTLTEGIGKIGADTTGFAAGEPEGFATNAVAALEILGDLDSGKIAFDGSNWSVTGAVDSAAKAVAAIAAFNVSPLKQLGASYNVPAPAVAAAAATPTVAATVTPAPAAPASAPPAPAAAAPTTAPVTTAYSWSAEKTAAGAITFTGSVPNQGFKGFMVTHADGKATDNTSIASGAPKTFVGGALYGFNALSAFDQGKLTFADGVWTLTGTVKDESVGKSAVAALGKIIDTKAWKIDITTATTTAATPPAPIVKPPAPAPVVKPAAPAAPAPEPYLFGATKKGGGAIALTGSVPTEGAKGYFGDIAGNAPTDGLKVVAKAPTDFITNALAGLDALGQLTDGQLSFDGTKWSLQGKSATVEGRTAVLGRVAALPSGKDWATDVAGPSDMEICSAQVATWAGSNAINFETRTTRFVKGTEAMLDSLAADLATCPKTRVDVEGNTDSDGEANANMALSVARAEAVVNALVKRGIKPERLYAVGYGETLPLAPNTTKANKAKNRRIEFKILDAGQK
jgi:outer membrane protein OmpA-like peptidoglycan-associated protein